MTSNNYLILGPNHNTLAKQIKERRDEALVLEEYPKVSFHIPEKTGDIDAYYDGQRVDPAKFDLLITPFLPPSINRLSKNFHNHSRVWSLLEAWYPRKDHIVNRRDACLTSNDKVLSHLAFLKNNVPSIPSVYGSGTLLQKHPELITTPDVFSKNPIGSEGKGIQRLPLNEVQALKKTSLYQGGLPLGPKTIRVYALTCLGQDLILGAKDCWARKGSYLSNSSAGGGQRLIPVEKLPEKVRTLALQATKALGLNFCGVDITRNGSSEEAPGEYVVIEGNANAGSSYYDQETKYTGIPTLRDALLDGLTIALDRDRKKKR